MKRIKSNEIEKGLNNSFRVYLCGNLKHDNSGLKHIKTDGYELGISLYDDFTFEKPHIHMFNCEFNYVLEGAIKLLMLEENKEYIFEKGDLFVIEPNEPYVCKCIAGTKTIFSKVPGGDDKRYLSMDEAVIRWGESWNSIYISGRQL